MSRRLRLALTLLFAGSFAQAIGPRQYLKVYDFSKGVDTYHGSTSLPDGFVQNSNDVLFDDVSPLTKIHGFTVAWSTKSYSYTGLWTYVDSNNNTWQLVRSSDQITANNLSGKTVLVATVSANNLVGETNAFGNAYFVDQTQGVYYWNGTNLVQVASSPDGSIITTFHNRLWVTGAAVPNGNQLYGSKYGDGTIWTTGLNATDPVQFTVGLQDNFDNVTAEYVYLDTLYLFKHSTIYGLYGFDQTNFQISFLTQECGCIDGNTIQTYNGSLNFVSLRGVENFNGYSCHRISDPIKNKIDPATLNSFSADSWVQQVPADWNAGTFSLSAVTASLSSAVSVPSLVLSTGTQGDTTTSNFQSGTLNNLVASNNTVGFNVVSGSVTNSGFETGSLVSGWNHGGVGTVVSSYGGCSGLLTPHSGTKFLQDKVSNVLGVVTTKVSALRCGDNFHLFDLNLVQPNTCSGWVQETLNMSGQSGTCFFITLQDTTNSQTVAQTDQYYSDGTNINFYWSSDANGPGFEYNFYDDFWGGVNTAINAVTPSSGTFTSRSFDTGFNQSYVVANALWTSGTNTPSFTLQHSADNSHWLDLTVSTGVSVLANRYIRSLSTFTLDNGLGNPVNNANEFLNSSTFSYVVSSGVFISQSHNISTATAFGNLGIVDTLNGGNIVFSICSSNNSGMVGKTCVNTTANSQITVSTNIFVQVISTFTVTNATQAPTLQATTVNWFSGTRSPPMASTVFDNRYWLAFASNTADGFNDMVEVLNTRGAWAPLDFHVGAFTQTRNNLYSADSLASGNIYLQNQGFGANGAPINAFVQTKDYSFGDLPADEYLYVLYPTVDNQGSCAVTFQYMPDLSGTNYSLGSPLESEFSTMRSVRLPFPIDATHQDFGQSMNFTIGTNDSQCPFQFTGFEGIFKERQPQ